MTPPELSVPYFYSDLDRLWDSSYSPTNQDIVQIRTRTAGIVETVFKISDSFARAVVPDPSARAITLAEKYGKRTNAGSATASTITSVTSDDSLGTDEDSLHEKSKGKFRLKTSSTRDLRFVDVGMFDH